MLNQCEQSVIRIPDKWKQVLNRVIKFYILAWVIVIIKSIVYLESISTVKEVIQNRSLVYQDRISFSCNNERRLSAPINKFKRR